MNFYMINCIILVCVCESVYALTINAIEGDTVYLPCNTTQPITGALWKRVENPESKSWLYKFREITSSMIYCRNGFMTDPILTGNLTAYIHAVKQSDTAVYQCHGLMLVNNTSGISPLGEEIHLMVVHASKKHEDVKKQRITTAMKNVSEDVRNITIEIESAHLPLGSPLHALPVTGDAPIYRTASTMTEDSPMFLPSTLVTQQSFYICLFVGSAITCLSISILLWMYCTDRFLCRCCINKYREHELVENIAFS